MKTGRDDFLCPIQPVSLGPTPPPAMAPYLKLGFYSPNPALCSSANPPLPKASSEPSLHPKVALFPQGLTHSPALSTDHGARAALLWRPASSVTSWGLTYPSWWPMPT